MELRLADLFPEPILEIRGKVSLEIGDRTVRDSSGCLVYEWDGPTVVDRLLP